MPYEVAWEIPDLMMAAKLSGDVTIDDILGFMEAYYNALETVGGEHLHIMLYIDEATSWPEDHKAVEAEIEELPKLEVKNYVCALAGPPPFFRLMQNVCFYLMRLRVEGFPLREGALEFMRQSDPAIREVLEG